LKRPMSSWSTSSSLTGIPTYARPPLSDFDVHRSAVGYDLNSILSVHEVRLVTNDYAFQHNGWRHQIEAGDIEPRMCRAKITLEISLGYAFTGLL
jgi:hypothetical protein